MKTLLSMVLIVGCGFVGYFCVKNIIEIIKSIKDKKKKKKGGEN